MIRRPLMVAITITALLLAPLSFAADEIGIFETIYESSLSYSETVEAVEAALDSSNFELHGSHDIRLPDDLQSAMIFVLTSPAYVEAAAAESPRTISAQILRVAVYTWGEEQKTYVNMANPVALAMVFYADSPKYDDLVAAAGSAAADLRGSLTGVPGRALSVAAEPVRSEKHYNKYKGDGPARVMARFRTWDKSQLEIESDSADNFDAVVERVKAALSAGNVADASETVGWETITSIRVRDDAVFLGLTNPYIEDRMVSINSRFRKDGKSDQSPYPGVDHVAALPTDLLIVREGEETLVLHYGQMWRMQLYFWDSGYRAFTANVGVPGAIANSIEEAVSGAR
jgi:uncharacterized protein (DUF302 family)